MPSFRIEQVNALIRQELDRAIRDALDVPEGCLVTIEAVHTSRDLHVANVAVSVYPAEQRKPMLKALNAQKGNLNRTIAKRLLMKFSPKLTFALDDREEKADRINRLLDQTSG